MLSHLFDHYSITLDLDDLNPSTRGDVAPFGNNIDKVITEASNAGRAQRRGRDADGAEQRRQPRMKSFHRRRGSFVVVKTLLSFRRGLQNQPAGVGYARQVP